MNTLVSFLNACKDYLDNYFEEVNRFYEEVDSDPEKAKSYYECMFIFGNYFIPFI